MILDGSAGLTTPGVVNTAGETIATTLVVTGVTTLTGGLNAALPVLSGGTGVTTKTGTGAVVLGTSPTITGATITVAATAAPAFSAYLSANQTGITNSTWIKAQVNTEEFDTNSNYDNATNYRFTPTVSGYYQVNGCINFNASTVNPTYVSTSIYKNGSSFKITSGTGNGVVDNGQEVSCLIYFNGSTDYVELYGYVVGSTNARFAGSSFYTYFQASMVRSA
jgi:hypothetical protein